MVYYAGDLRFYLSELEEERLKIYVFRRELPLCYEVVTQTIEAWKQKLKDRVTLPGQPIPEAFVPSRDDDDVVGEKDDDRDDEEGTRAGWLRSERPWNQIPDLNARLDNGDEDCRAALPQKPPLSSSQVKSTSSPERLHRRGRAERKASQKLLTSPVGSSPSGKAKGDGQEKHEEGNACRKKRRRWSPELHCQFLNALQELGVATPRHIKERMKVDGLTNDEIKSHLQKYRLNKRNPSVQRDEGPPPARAQAPPQLFIVRGIWMPPPDLAAVTSSMSLPPTTN